MTELICECGEKASGPDVESVTAAMQRHLSASGHFLQGPPPDGAPVEAEEAPEPTEDPPAEESE